VVNGSGLPDDPLQDPPTGLDYLSLAMLVRGPSSCHVMKLFNYPAPPSRGACSACVDPQALRGWKAAAGLPAGPVDKDWVAPDGWPVPDDATAAWQSVRGDETGREIDERLKLAPCWRPSRRESRPLVQGLHLWLY
jgi:hypothetical protein